MKFVGRIFSIIGGVIGILTGLALIGTGVCLLLINVPEVKDVFLKLMQLAQDKSNIPFTDYLDLMIAGSIISAIIEFLYAALCFTGAGLSFSCHKNKSYIATIVINVIACFNTFAILGAIFGAIFDKKSE